MPEAVLLDNDILLKASCYQIDAETVACVTVGSVPPAGLSVSRFVVRDLIRRSPQVRNRSDADESFVRLMAKIQFIDPTDREIEMAAEIEANAQKAAQDLDGGESQLLAILIERNLLLLITGDKRAIRAIEGTSAGSSEIGPRIGCLEQLIASIVARADLAKIRAKVCREAGADKAISICFCCQSATTPFNAVAAGLKSYVDHLRTVAPSILVTSNDLSGAIS